jgi:4'-phosphopantetheinyl transferase
MECSKVVQVWTVRIDAANIANTDIAQCRRILTPQERDRARGFHFDHLQHAFILGRAALRVLLGSYLDLHPGAVQFTYGPRGKPKLETSGLEFNASHSDGLAVFAFTFGCEIGVDVEQVRPLPDIAGIANRFFCREEAAELLALPLDERERAFFRCWTRKEAYIKATGEGLSAALDSFQVTLGPGVPARFVHFIHESTAVESWTLHDLGLTPAYAGALAYPDAPRSTVLLPPVDAAELFAEW